MKVRSDSLAVEQSTHNERDVNGNLRPGHDIFSVLGYLPSTGGAMLLRFNITRSERIKKAEAILPQSPIFALSERDYDRTGLFEAAYLILGARCADLNKLWFYRFFHNQVKPRMIQKSGAAKIIPGHAGTFTSYRAVNIPFCGKRFSFFELSGYDPENIFTSNSRNFHIIPSIAFE